MIIAKMNDWDFVIKMRKSNQDCCQDEEKLMTMQNLDHIRKKNNVTGIKKWFLKKNIAQINHISQL